MQRQSKVYELMIRARPDESVSAADKHQRFLEAIRSLAVPWSGLPDQAIPPVPGFGGNVSAVGGLTKWFGGAVRSCQVSYTYRRLLRDTGSHDDWLDIMLYPSKVDVAYVLDSVIPKFIEAFSAYSLSYVSDSAKDALYELEPLGPAVSNARFQVSWISPVCFFDQTLCERAFRLSPAEVAGRVRGTVQDVRLLSSGVYILGTSQVLSVDETVRMSQELRSAILS